ncbi:FlgD immunoglobulin-like domain containing protein [Longivirga aurantiaca]|uniref:FlgD immunoglobulin-like domain containing protein n=1 Tax=Longivirga aurantiaca TaxID=1837743 RepID=A0ABW1T0K2_9ACTN
MKRVRALVLSLTTAALLATGVVFPGAVWADAPSTVPTITSPAQDAVVSGVVTISITSTAPRVQLQIGGETMGVFTPAGSTVTYSWSSWGWENASWPIKATDCSSMDECAWDGDTVDVTLSNTLPVITTPSSGSVLPGTTGFSFSATAPSPAVAFLVDFVAVAYDDAAPFTTTIDPTTLSEGDHTLVVRECSSALDRCGGAESAYVNITTANLHPTITAQSPNPFSPNGNGVKKTSTTTFTLSEAEAITWTALNATQDVVRGPVQLGTLNPGTHVYTWDGKDAGGVAVPNGTYTIRIAGTSGGFSGSDTTTVVVDSTLPTLTSVVGAGLTFYPYPDSYKDSFTPTVVLSENATLTLTVRSSTNALVRKIAATRWAGKVGIAWNGRNTAGALVPAGVYRWTLTAVDKAGNVRATPSHTVTVSLKKLVTKTVNVQLTASKRIATNRSATCAAVRTSTYGVTGAWFYNNCDIRKTGPQWVEGSFSAVLPSAVSYSKLTLQVYGHTHGHNGYMPVARGYGWIDRVGGASWVSNALDIRATTGRWISMVSSPGAGFVSSTRRVTFGFGVGNQWYPAPNEVDVRYVRLVVVAKVLV